MATIPRLAPFRLTLSLNLARPTFQPLPTMSLLIDSRQPLTVYFRGSGCNEEGKRKNPTRQLNTTGPDLRRTQNSGRLVVTGTHLDTVEIREAKAHGITVDHISDCLALQVAHLLTAQELCNKLVQIHQ
ncbi:hypothetical protein B0H14DRAFT_3510810 [Mycena olivaceomarginata]|nr:hypothetical protein B0H14DRAFT_3510810 [Mycena olivaceomarginata]